MANETTTTTLSELLPEIVYEAMFIANEKSIMRGLVKNYNVPLGAGKNVNVPIYPRQTAAAVAEGTDLVNAAVDTTSAILTVSEVGLMTTVTDLARKTAASNVIADVGRLFGEAIARKMDQDLMALFDSLSVTVGDGTGALTAADVFNAVAKLRSQGLSPDGISCVLHPEIAYDLKANMTNTFADPNAGDVQNEAMRTGFVGMLAGIPVYESGNMLDTGSAGDYKGGVIHTDSLGLAVLTDINIEVERDASLRADELVGTATYGVGELNDAYGVAMHMQSSINP